MSYFLSDYLDIEMDGLGDDESQRLTELPLYLQSSPTLDTLDTLDNSPDLDHILNFGHPMGHSFPLSSNASYPEFGSVPSSLPLLDLQDIRGHNQTLLNSSSHSFPGIHHHAASFPSFSTVLARKQGEDPWTTEVLMRTDQSPTLMHQPSSSLGSFGFSASESDPSHFPDGWMSSNASVVNRTESVWSSDSLFTNTSFEDFSVNDKSSAFRAANASPTLPPLAINTKTVKDQKGAENDQISFNAGPEDATTPRPIPKPTKPGRKGELTAEQKDHAARIRRIGACATCRRRRAKCDDGIPCSTCKKYFRNNPEKLAENPCRGESLKELVDLILDTNAFPKGPYDRLLSQKHTIRATNLMIPLDLGFGYVPFRCRISLLNLGGNSAHLDAFQHRHVEYPWPPASGSSISRSREDRVFPAILADDDTFIISQVETHLNRMLMDPKQFHFFPVWHSQLKVLRLFYKYFLDLPSRSRTPLKQALQILILVHVGGDLRLFRDDPVTARINEQFFPGTPHEYISPCFIRAQLGPLFSKLAHSLMSDVLKQLERLSSLQDPAHFPMVIATFSVLFMALESLQYHFAKVAYHSDIDSLGQLSEQPAVRDLDDFEAADILLRFYQSTSCHERLGALVDLPSEPDLSPISRTRSRAGSTSSMRWPTSCPAADNHGAMEFLQTLGSALRDAAPYIAEKDRRSPIVATSDMSSFFDRLLAKMYCLQKPIAA